MRSWTDPWLRRSSVCPKVRSAHAPKHCAVRLFNRTSGFPQHVNSAALILPSLGAPSFRQTLLTPKLPTALSDGPAPPLAAAATAVVDSETEQCARVSELHWLPTPPEWLRLPPESPPEAPTTATHVTAAADISTEQVKSAANEDGACNRGEPAPTPPEFLRLRPPPDKAGPAQPTAKRRKAGGGQQLYMDLGQASWKYSTCGVCGMTYTHGLPADEKLHTSYHATVTNGISFRVRSSPRTPHTHTAASAMRSDAGTTR
jgi:hypothetical protein